jgi:hypothetical protein
VLGGDDDESAFSEWLAQQLTAAPGADIYADVFSDAQAAILKWRRRYRGAPKLWRSLFKADKVIKELIETAPVIDAVRTIVNEAELDEGERFTIVDLCSGKGFLSMFLSEMLPVERVERSFLVDKAWPPHNWEGPIRSHHISDAHIYRERSASGDDEPYDEGGETYFSTWPVPMHTSKQDIKKGASTLRSMERHLLKRCSGPVLVLAVHLCGTLSLRAIDLYNELSRREGPGRASFLALKPCCLPRMVHAKRNETFVIGSHSFPAKDVCAPGSFTATGWKGPPRLHLRGKFETWTTMLYRGIDVDPSTGGTKKIHYSPVQLKGGFQNLYIFAETSKTDALWEGQLSRNLRGYPQDHQKLLL